MIKSRQRITRLAWATDIHFDHAEPGAKVAFLAALQHSDAEALCLTGDLSEAPQLTAHLQEIAEAFARPVYFVLGNHDYYHGSLTAVRAEMQALSQQSEWLRWLPACGLIPLNDQTVLLGHDGWGDGRYGNLAQSWIKMTDFRLIADFVAAGEAGREALLNQLGDQGAEHLARFLPEALSQFEQVVVLMHAPPLRESCLYGTDIADDNWAPYFACKAMGDVLLDHAARYPTRQLTVLAGHTHNVCDILPLPNLRIRVGAASYGQPGLSDTLNL